MLSPQFQLIQGGCHACLHCLPRGGHGKLISVRELANACRNTSYRADLLPLHCRLQMRLVWFIADHKSSSIGKRNIIFRILHLHVLRLEVAIHHKASHKKVFAETKCRQLLGSYVDRRTYFHILSNLQGG